MSRLSLCFLLALALISAGCGYGSKYMASGSGAGSPTVTELVPPNANAGGMAFTLTVNGSGFGTDAVVYWGTTPQSTMYLSGNQVTAQIPAADIMNPGMVAVYVRTGGKNSNSVNFTVQ
ncbi:MAG: IPT/TIG domain-containing protein [Terriglobales bacterium]